MLDESSHPKSPERVAYRKGITGRITFDSFTPITRLTRTLVFVTIYMLFRVPWRTREYYRQVKSSFHNITCSCCCCWGNYIL